MERTLQKSLQVILLSLGLALVFNFLFFGKLIGVSFFIFTATLLAAVGYFGKQNGLRVRQSWWLFLLIAVFAFLPTVRANEFLIFLNVCTVFGLLMLLAHQLVGTPVFLMRLMDYLSLLVIVPFRMLGNAVTTVATLVQFRSKVQRRDTWLRVLKGVVMALPILFIFGTLFSQADLAFAQFLNNIVDIQISERGLQYSIVLFLAFVAGLSFLSYTFFGKPVVSTEEVAAGSVTEQGSSVEVMVFLGLIAALFLLFIGFQVTYLFGGEANIVNTGFTYAEYARRGFWELLAVALLSLLVLLASEKLAGADRMSSKRFIVPAVVLIAEVGVVMFSAFTRLTLYIDVYGMTVLRFYVVGFILLLFALFVLLAVKFLKSKPEQFFTFGALCAVVGFIAVVNFANPDAVIARSNLEQFKQTGKIDVFYISTLSADAQLGKIEVYKMLEGEEQQVMGQFLQEDKVDLVRNSANWQSFNFSRARAFKSLEMAE